MDMLACSNCIIDSMITLYILHTRNSCRHHVIDDIDMKRKTVMMRDN
jgi:hypothetical protein